jgi:hypothetical protein
MLRCSLSTPIDKYGPGESSCREYPRRTQLSFPAWLLLSPRVVVSQLRQACGAKLLAASTQLDPPSFHSDETHSPLRIFMRVFWLSNIADCREQGFSRITLNLDKFLISMQLRQRR